MNKYKLSTTKNIFSYKLDHKLEGIVAVVFYFIGIIIISISIYINDQYIILLFVSITVFIITLLSRQFPKQWIFLASLLAANPINWGAVVPCNLIFAFCLIVIHIRYLLELPRWLYISSIIGVIGFIISSHNWISGNILLDILQQTSYMISYLLGPLLLMPIIYFRMSEVENSSDKLKGLLYYLILPSTFILLMVYFSGSQIQNSYTDIQLGMNTRLYKFGNLLFNFTRTQIGFLFASLICASMAIVICQVKTYHKLLAAICLLANFLLLLITGSIGSSFACLCGITAIFVASLHKFNFIKILFIIIIFCLLFLTWSAAPLKIKYYIENRFEERYNSKSGVNIADRSFLWKNAANYIFENPEGVGWTLLVGERFKHNPHNDYIVYALSYGIIVGIVYLCLILRMIICFFRKSKRIDTDHSAMAINLAGLGTSVVVFINSMSDHMVANKWYFNVIWSLIWYSYFCGKTVCKNTYNGH